MFDIVRDIPKPPDMPAKRAGNKYPFAEMQVGDSFVVPYSDRENDEPEEKFRNRVYKSAREYARRHNTGENHIKFSAAIMKEDDKQKVNGQPRYVTGDVVVWRDA